jgi:hypothetical protein
MRLFLTVLLVGSTSALAQELPSNLLLKCDGKRTITFHPFKGIPPVIGERFQATLRLKDGELADVDSHWMTSKGCALANGIVRCTSKTVVPTESGSERREINSYIVRETGEYLFLETWSFEGKNATGRQTGDMKYRRTGICRQASQPIF